MATQGDASLALGYALVGLSARFCALMPFQGVPMITRYYPGCRFACPGLCARRAFSPPLLNQGVPMIIPRVSLRLPWAKEVIGLSARLVCFCHILITGPANDYFTQSRATPSEAKLTIRCESRLRPELLDVMRSSNHSKCRMSLFLSCSCPLFLPVPFWGKGGEALRLSDF